MNQSLASNISVSFFPQRISFNWGIFWVLTSLLILSLFVASIAQLNSYTRERYLMKDYQTQIKELEQGNKILKVNFSKADSYSNIASYIESNSFVKAAKLEYIHVLEETVFAQ